MAEWPGKKNIRLRRESWGNALANLLDLPRDVLLELPRLTLLGNLELTMENHRGLIHFDSEHILISTAGGQIEVQGQELEIKSILPEQLVLSGKITGLRFFG